MRCRKKAHFIAVLLVLSVVLASCGGRYGARPPGYWDTHVEKYSVEEALESFGEGLFISTFVMPDRSVRDPKEDIFFCLEYTEGGSAEREEDWISFSSRVIYQEESLPYSMVTMEVTFKDENTITDHATLENGDAITSHTFGDVDVTCVWFKNDKLDVYGKLFAYFSIDNRHFEVHSYVGGLSGLTQTEAEEKSKFLMDSLEWLFSEYSP